VQELSDYINYQRQIGYYMQIFNIGSVFILDHEHRKNVYYKRHSWNAIDEVLANGILKAKVDFGARVENSKSEHKLQLNMSKQMAKQAFSNSTPCVDYNDRNRYCAFNPCKNPHRCSVSGCFQNHLAYKHVAQGERFRSNSEPQGQPS
jgi:hypothetical protein